MLKRNIILTLGLLLGANQVSLAGYSVKDFGSAVLSGAKDIGVCASAIAAVGIYTASLAYITVKIDRTLVSWWKKVDKPLARWWQKAKTELNQPVVYDFY